MKIKRQKQIGNFLVEEFGEEKGQRLFDRQDRMLGNLIEKQQGKSKSQMKTLIQTILPSIALSLYKTLADDTTEDQAYEYMKRYMFDIVGSEMHSSMEKMELVPGFFSIYSSIFCDADNVTYGGLKKLGFTRTKTLGYGGDCCDFHYFVEN